LPSLNNLFEDSIPQIPKMAQVGEQAVQLSDKEDESIAEAKKLI